MHARERVAFSVRGEVEEGGWPKRGSAPVDVAAGAAQRQGDQEERCPQADPGRPGQEALRAQARLACSQAHCPSPQAHFHPPQVNDWHASEQTARLARSC